MPHFIMEYSENIKNILDVQSVFTEVTKILKESNIFPLAGIRCRAIQVEEYRIADNEEDYAFIHMVLKIGSGRKTSELKEVCDNLFEKLTELLSPIQQKRLLAISFVLEELHPILNYKKNNIHQFLKNRES